MGDAISKKTRKALTLNSKYDIVKRLQGCVKRSEVCFEVGLNKTMTILEPIFLIVKTISMSDEEKENKDEESVGMELIPTPTTSEALRHIDSVRHFLQSQNTPQRVLDRLSEVELHINCIHFTKINQIKINDFFKKDFQKLL
ncbi:unnamed protein product [Acanthoscelides obtectus]|uniref:Uncharacterized protein n=1 Tax=Acanthoscelides obtectus TaxID=200917 RepID=A0A9P0KFZ3_ACAOB|nr:unnamed protein product [Acanthoscelides obtectus]CAK1675287.1 hypothetical protein AOBTE_LOCUS30109 [Acanthoscelides obtectus]